MASIKISKLADLSKDLLTNDDVFIVNDANLTTMSIKYGTIVEKIQETDHLFTGDVEFSGSVTVSGILANRNFYTKTEVDKIVSDGDAALQVDIDLLETQQGKFIDNIGTAASQYTTLDLAGSGSILSSGPGTVLGSLKKLGLGHDASANRIEATEIATADNTDAIAVNAAAIATNLASITALEAAVGIGGSNVSDNATNITANSDLIDSLYALVGQPEGALKINFTNNGNMAGDYTVTEALTALDGNVVSINASLATLTTNATAQGVASDANRTGINTIQAALISGLNAYIPTTNTASELAAFLASYLGNNTTPVA